MTDITSQAIAGALDALANGKPLKTDGRLTAGNLAKEAGVSRASLYRHFAKRPDLKRAYDTLRQNDISEEMVAPESMKQENRLLRAEAKQLRSALLEARRRVSQESELKAHQILLLWLENKRLREEVERLSAMAKSNVVPLRN